MKTYKTHHYAPWSEDRAAVGGLTRAAMQPGDAHSSCTRCGVGVILKKVGGMKFWVANGAVGKWVSKRPPCVVLEDEDKTEYPEVEDPHLAKDKPLGLGYMQKRGAS